VLKVEKRVLQTLSDEQIRTLLSRKPKTFDQWRLSALIALTLDTGVRIEEALTLTALTGEVNGQTVTWRIVSAEHDPVTTTFTGTLNEAGTRMEGRFLSNKKGGSFRAVRQ
jgi:integrase